MLVMLGSNGATLQKYLKALDADDESIYFKTFTDGAINKCAVGERKVTVKDMDNKVVAEFIGRYTQARAHRRKLVTSSIRSIYVSQSKFKKLMG